MSEKKLNLITFSWPPSSWKTSVIIKIIKDFLQKNIKIWVVKMDCLMTDDDKLYAELWIPVKKALSANICPDHFFVSNIEEIFDWGKKQDLEILITESAGLCNRCSPYIKDIKAVCVIDNLSWINTPKKIGPMLKLADIVIVTKWDIVSQAEREVFVSRIKTVNPKAVVMHVNWLNGQWSYELSNLLLEDKQFYETLEGMYLRFSMPTAVCSYCLWETRIWKRFQMWNVKKVNLDD